jgi:hypothetical protein
VTITREFPPEPTQVIDRRVFVELLRKAAASYLGTLSMSPVQYFTKRIFRLTSDGRVTAEDMNFPNYRTMVPGACATGSYR